MIRYPDNSRHFMVERFRHPDGVLYFEPFWHEAEPGTAIHVARGTVRGDGPWKVGDAVITVVGCHGADPEMALALADWQQYLAGCAGEYAPRSQIVETARRYGALD